MGQPEQWRHRLPQSLPGLPNPDRNCSPRMGGRGASLLPEPVVRAGYQLQLAQEVASGSLAAH